MSETYRILIADDHRLIRRGLRSVLEVEPDIEIVGEATNGQEAIDLALQLTPDIILMDLQMPDLSGIEATRQILEVLPETHILVITLFDDDDSVFLALRAGARGYILKDADEIEIISAIRTVSNGAAIFSPAVATRVLALFHRFDGQVAEPAFPNLTPREREILELIAEGKSNQRMAQELNLTVKTIGNNVSNIFSKLQVADRSEAIVRAREAGLGRGQG